MSRQFITAVFLFTVSPLPVFSADGDGVFLPPASVIDVDAEQSAEPNPIFVFPTPIDITGVTISGANNYASFSDIASMLATPGDSQTSARVALLDEEPVSQKPNDAVLPPKPPAKEVSNNGDDNSQTKKPAIRRWGRLWLNQRIGISGWRKQKSDKNEKEDKDGADKGQTKNVDKPSQPNDTDSEQSVVPPPAVPPTGI